ncbi:MAG: SusD/RagB family nutrient-binding outer membrane lipoprotein [Muribaculaceae bacterium]
MKKNIFIAIAAMFALALTACSEDTMDKINEDKGNPGIELVPSRLLVTDAMTSTAFTTVSGSYAWYLSLLTEQYCGTGGNQFYKAEMRNANEWASSTTFNNEWNGTYGNLMNIKTLIDRATKENSGETDILGMAQVLWVLNFGVLTDLHGDIPYSEALQGSDNLQPKLDSQESIYADLLKVLDSAIENLTAAEEARMNNCGSQDLFYGGKLSSWKALAYAAKARYLIHQSAVNPSVIAQAEVAAQTAVDLGFNGCELSEFNGVTCDNPWSAFQWSRGYVATSTTAIELMESVEYPLIDAYTYYTVYDLGFYYGHTPGDEAEAQESWTDLYPYWQDFGSQPVHVFSRSELYFILAEAQLRQGKDATEAFQEGVASFINEVDSWIEEGLDGYAYAESLGTPNLEMLFQQKYLSQIADEQIETYNDLRRCAAMGESYITLTNPRNNQSGLNRWPYLLPYGNGSVLSNPNVAQAYGDGSYIYSTKVWWANK